MEQTVQQLEATFQIHECAIEDDHGVTNQEVEAVYQSGDLPGATYYGDIENRDEVMFEAGAELVRKRWELWKQFAKQHGSSFTFPSGVALPKVHTVLPYLVFQMLPSEIIDGLMIADRVVSFKIEDTTVQLLDEAGEVMLGISAIKLMAQASVIMDFLLGPDGIMAVAECIAANQPPVDYLRQDVEQLVEATAADERMQQVIGEDPTADVVKALDLMEAGSDYMKFEEYLDIMRKLHLYDDMSADMRVPFDQSVVYRWRDIKALKDLLARVELNPKSNALTRHMAEMRSLGDRLDTAYLEIRHLRSVLEHEATALEEEAKKLKKKGNLTTAGILIRSSNRLNQQRGLLGPMPADAIDVVTRLYAAYNDERRQRQQLVRFIATECKKRLDDLGIPEDGAATDYQEMVRGFVRDLLNNLSAVLNPVETPAPEAPSVSSEADPEAAHNDDEVVVEASNDAEMLRPQISG